jgi:hypothetical protein
VRVFIRHLPQNDGEARDTRKAITIGDKGLMMAANEVLGLLAAGGCMLAG